MLMWKCTSAISWVCCCYLFLHESKNKKIQTNKHCQRYNHANTEFRYRNQFPLLRSWRRQRKECLKGYTRWFWDWGDKFWIESWVWCPDCWGVYCMCICAWVHMHDRAASAAECIALPRSSERTVMHGLRVVMNKTVSLVFLLDWPLLMAPGYSSSVLMWKAARHSTA